MSQALDMGDMPLEHIDLSRHDIFASEDVLETFKRLRKEDPVHYCPDSPFGAFWSITRYEDCLAVDTDHKRFSSSDKLGGIMIDDNVVNPPVEGMHVSAFITKDQPEHAPIRRTALEDVELGGKTIKKGDKVVMWYYSGNHDEDVFDDPRTVRFDRENGNRHLSFGFGIHWCMGLRVAELQLRTLWQQILDKFEKIELVGEPVRIKSNFVNGYSQMNVKVTRH